MSASPSPFPESPRELGMLLAAIAACQSAGGVGALASREALESWYPTLKKPDYNPPGWVFGPAWTALYTLMGLTLFRLRKLRGAGVETGAALPLFTVQLLLNALWSTLFFRFRSPRWAFAEIVVLWLAIALTIRAVWRVSRGAALLLVPYLLWVSVALTLNFSIWRENRGTARGLLGRLAAARR